MIITCPACSKRYLVEETAIGETGRHVQCIACQHEWFFKPLSEAPKHNQVHLDLIGVKSSAARTGARLNISWIFMISTIIVLFIGLYFARHSIVLYFPQSAKIFQVVGLPIQPRPMGLALENVKSSLKADAIENQVVIKGDIINKSDQVQQVPVLKIMALGDCTKASFVERTITQVFKKRNGTCTIAKWTYTPAASRLFPGEKLFFEIHSDRPLTGAKKINVKF